MKTILVGFDESAESLRAAEQATDLCKRTGARLLFATAVPLPTAEGPLLPEFSESDGRLRQSARAKLERARRQDVALLKLFAGAPAQRRAHHSDGGQSTHGAPVSGQAARRTHA